MAEAETFDPRPTEVEARRAWLSKVVGGGRPLWEVLRDLGCFRPDDSFDSFNPEDMARLREWEESVGYDSRK